MKFPSLCCVLLASSCATVSRPSEPTLGSVSLQPRGGRTGGAAKSNSWTRGAVFGERTSLTLRDDGSWAGNCKGGTLDVKPTADGQFLEGIQYRGGSAQTIHLAVKPPHLVLEDPVNELHLEGEEMLPQSYLALYCLVSDA